MKQKGNIGKPLKKLCLFKTTHYSLDALIVPFNYIGKKTNVFNLAYKLVTEPALVNKHYLC